eukprot:TRINITY_DN1347_c0_g2_i1.p1 TRINITY_DN1347_c0_g2~~TRINITY_DN1347_c0_g2_i1.p1  ORF type:complete len:754 (+),score=137.58 TRINITY_DN1347_c0_g2_i1:23-2263(+)
MYWQDIQNGSLPDRRKRRSIPEAYNTGRRSSMTSRSSRGSRGSEYELASRSRSRSKSRERSWDRDRDRDSTASSSRLAEILNKRDRLVDTRPTKTYSRNISDVRSATSTYSSRPYTYSRREREHEQSRASVRSSTASTSKSIEELLLELKEEKLHNSKLQRGLTSARTKTPVQLSARESIVSGSSLTRSMTEDTSPMAYVERPGLSHEEYARLNRRNKEWQEVLRKRAEAQAIETSSSREEQPASPPQPHPQAEPEPLETAPQPFLARRFESTASPPDQDIISLKDIPIADVEISRTSTSPTVIADSMWKINVTKKDGSCVVVHAHSTDSFGDVKKTIEAKTGVASCDMVLYAGAQVLLDLYLLSDMDPSSGYFQFPPAVEHTTLSIKMDYENSNLASPRSLNFTMPQGNENDHDLDADLLDRNVKRFTTEIEKLDMGASENISLEGKQKDGDDIETDTDDDKSTDPLSKYGSMCSVPDVLLTVPVAKEWHGTVQTEKGEVAVRWSNVVKAPCLGANCYTGVQEVMSKGFLKKQHHPAEMFFLDISQKSALGYSVRQRSGTGPMAKMLADYEFKKMTGTMKWGTLEGPFSMAEGDIDLTLVRYKEKLRTGFITAVLTILVLWVSFDCFDMDLFSDGPFESGSLEEAFNSVDPDEAPSASIISAVVSFTLVPLMEFWPYIVGGLCGLGGVLFTVSRPDIAKKILSKVFGGLLLGIIQRLATALRYALGHTAKRVAALLLPPEEAKKK